jgi:tetratricopeptide (TPR) repeat protein
VSPDTLALFLLAATVGLYLWLRPRKRDAFWDVTAVRPQPPSVPVPKVHEGSTGAEAAGRLRQLPEADPQHRLAWVSSAEQEYVRGNFREAFALYDKAIAAGRVPARAYRRAALAANRVGQDERALGFLKKAVQQLPPAQVTGAMWFNMGCFAARLGVLQEALNYLKRAIDRGYTNLRKFRTDPDLNPLRGRREFNSLLKRLDL